MMQAQDIWHDITEIKGKRILGRNSIFFNLDSLKLFCFITSYLNFLKTILGEREGFFGKHCVLCAIFQGVGRLLTAFWVLPERHQLWEEGLYLINKKRVRVRTNKRSSKSNPLISLPSCMPDHLWHQLQSCSCCFQAALIDTSPGCWPALGTDSGLVFPHPFPSPFHSHRPKEVENESKLFTPQFFEIKQISEALWKWKMTIIF